jgi:branched-chain amino acid transport system ATP-binding protein
VIKEVADRVSVLQSGKLLTTGTYEEVSSNPRVIAAYLGGRGGAAAAQQESHV